MPIGGAEDKWAKRTILSHFVDHCGGSTAHIIVIPSASSAPHEVAKDYSEIFSDLGAGRVTTLHIADRCHADFSDYAETINEATGFFFTGGDQVRLMSLIGDTHLAQAIHQRFLQGIHIAGTSAGASMMSRRMIAFGDNGDMRSRHRVKISSGLGLTDSFIIDQHFSQRNRLGRLLMAVSQHPESTGIGIDEDTAFVISPDGSQKVMGSGSVTLVNRQPTSPHDFCAAHSCYHYTLDGFNVRVLTAPS